MTKMMTMMTMTLTLSMLTMMTMKTKTGRTNAARKVVVRQLKEVNIEAGSPKAVKVENRKREARLMMRAREEDLHICHVPTKANKLPFQIHIICSQSPIDHPQRILTYVYVYSRQTYYCKSHFSNVHI